MFQWVKNIFSNKKKITEHHYCKYDLKPVTGRALSVVMGLSREQVVSLVNAKKLTLNDQLIVDLESRLESGSYRITFFAKHQVWHFHID